VRCEFGKLWTVGDKLCSWVTGHKSASASLQIFHNSVCKHKFLSHYQRLTHNLNRGTTWNWGNIRCACHVTPVKQWATNFRHTILPSIHVGNAALYRLLSPKAGQCSRWAATNWAVAAAPVGTQPCLWAVGCCAVIIPSIQCDAQRAHIMTVFWHVTPCCWARDSRRLEALSHNATGKCPSNTAVY